MHLDSTILFRIFSPAKTHPIQLSFGAGIKLVDYLECYVVYIVVSFFMLSISFVQSYRVEDACKKERYEFGLSISCHSFTALTTHARFA